VTRPIWLGTMLEGDLTLLERALGMEPFTEL
jgi:hypothetical protein